jgi:hypothetical protein
MTTMKRRAVPLLLALTAASAAVGVAHADRRAQPSVVVPSLIAPTGFSDGTDGALTAPTGFSDGTDGALTAPTGFSDGTDAAIAPTAEPALESVSASG